MKKTILKLTGLLALAALMVFNVQVFQGQYTSDSEILALSSLAIAQAESGGSDSYTCSSGGPGSTSCSASSNLGGGGVSGGTSCSVTCSSGYYACCNAYHNKCQCRKS